LLTGYAKKPNYVYGKQLAEQVISKNPMVTKLMEVLGPQYTDHDGEYTRVMKLARPRRGDIEQQHCRRSRVAIR
jgi:large subunit ribosomal protein L17